MAMLELKHSRSRSFDRRQAAVLQKRTSSGVREGQANLAGIGSNTHAEERTDAARP